MIIFVSGEDSYRVKEYRDSMRVRFLEKFDPSGINTAEFSFGEQKRPPLADVFQAIMSPPFLGQKRLVLLEGAMTSTKKDEAVIWSQSLARLSETSIVVFWDITDGGKSYEKSPLLTSLKSLPDIHSYEFPLLTGASLEKWIIQNVQEAGGKIDRRAVEMLTVRVGSDLWRLQGEIKKLVEYADGQLISVDMVENLVQANADDQLFALMDALSQRRAASALALLHEQRLFGTNDFQLFSMLTRQVRLLLAARLSLDERPRISKQEFATEFSIHPFVAQKTLSQAQTFKTSHLRRMHAAILDLEEVSKTGKHSAGVAADLLIQMFLEQNG